MDESFSIAMYIRTSVQLVSMITTVSMYISTEGFVQPNQLTIMMTPNPRNLACCFESSGCL